MTMTILPLALKSLSNRRFPALLTLATIAISVMLLLGVQHVRDEARQSFASTISGTDLIVGARSGPINLLLYAVFHIGDATNNVSWQSYKEISSLPDVAWSIPISLGDSHRGFRVVGTTSEFFSHYLYGAKHSLEFSAGNSFNDLYDAVIGAEVAAKLGYVAGQPIVVVLRRTGTPVDASVFVSLGAIEAIHVDWQSGTRVPGQTMTAEQAREQDLTPKAITAFLLGLKSRIATFGLQRQINEYDAESLMAILPGVTLQQLWGLVGVAENALLVVSALVVVAGLLGMLTALVTTLNERRREMAILRSIGARPHHVFTLLMLEAVLLTIGGMAVGLVLLYVGLILARGFVEAHYGLQISLGMPNAQEWILLGAVCGSGLLAGCLPAWLAYRNALADGLSLRL
jgi:putative ABC transport system permease protein